MVSSGCCRTHSTHTNAPQKPRGTSSNQPQLCVHSNSFLLVLLVRSKNTHTHTHTHTYRTPHPPRVQTQAWAEIQRFRASAVLDVARNSFISGSAVLGSAEMNQFRASAVLDVARNSFISSSAVLGSARNEPIPGSAVLDVCPEPPDSANLPPMRRSVSTPACFLKTKLIHICCHLLHGRGCKATPLCCMHGCAHHEHQH